jgi:hypothetical protein
MNAKKAKALRKMVRNYVEHTKAGEEIKKVDYLEADNAGAKYYDIVSETGDDYDEILGKMTEEERSKIKMVNLYTGTLRVKGDTQRGLYHHFKKRLVELEKRQKNGSSQ